MTYPTITELPEAPSRSEDTSTEFSNKTDALLGALDGFVTDVNAAGDYIQDTATEVEEFSETAENAADVAVGAANYKGDWTIVTDVSQGESYSYDGGTWIAKIDSVGQTPAEGTYWLKGVGTAAYLDSGTGSDQVPKNSDLGSSAYVSTGTGSDDVPTNEDIGFLGNNAAIEDFDDFDFSLLKSGFRFFYNSTTLNLPSEFSDIADSGSAIVFKNAAANFGGFLVMRSTGQMGIVYVAGNVVSGTNSAHTTATDATSAQINAGSGGGAVTSEGLSGSEYNPANRYYESSAQTLSLGGTISVSHGLGEEPKWVQLILECTTATIGYSVGDRVLVYGVSCDNDGDPRNSTVSIDSTNITVYLNSNRAAWYLLGPSGGDASYSDWDLFIKVGI